MYKKLFVLGVFVAVLMFLPSVNFGKIIFDIRYPQLQNVVHEMQASMETTRPERKDQLDLEDIHTGDVLIRVHESVDYEYEIIVTKSPYYTLEGCYVDTVFSEEGKPQSEFIMQDSCADMGLIEYDGKPLTGWNQGNYVKKSTLDPISQEELKLLVAQLRPAP